MGFLKRVLGDETKAKKETPVVIPDHQKQKIIEIEKQNAIDNRQAQLRKLVEKESEEKKQIIYSGDTPIFEVHGFFGVGGQAMVKGKVQRGRIKAKSKFYSGKKKFNIEEIRNSQGPVLVLLKGENGTLFLDSSKGFHHKNGDLLELEEPQ